MRVRLNRRVSTSSESNFNVGSFGFRGTLLEMVAEILVDRGKLIN